MTIQIQKTKVKDALKALSSEEEAAANRLCELEAKLAPFEADMKEYEAVKKYLASVTGDAGRFDPSLPVVLEVDGGRLEFGPKSKKREITDKDGLIQELKRKAGGYEGILKFIKINLGDVDKYLSVAEGKPYIGEVEGSRSLKSVIPK